ncbi:MAG: VOC family protein [Halolamina sp.]
MTGVSHLGHVHLKVRDLERVVEFYREMLGLEVVERVGRFVFLSLGEHHHDLALQGLDGDEPAPGPGASEPGLYHVAWELADAEALKTAYERLLERDVTVSPVDHGISKALYFEDPSGNGVELYVDTRDRRDIDEWDGRNEHFDPAAL